MKKIETIILILISIFSIFYANSTFADSLKIAKGNSEKDIINIIMTAGGYLAFVAGTLAFLVIIGGGIYYITAAGSSERTDQAKKVILYAIVGLVIIALSGLMVRVAIDVFIKNSNSDQVIQEHKRQEQEKKDQEEGNPISKPPIIDHFACSDYCPKPIEDYMVKIYEGVTDPDECRKIGGRPSTYYGWGEFHICLAE